MNAWMRLLATGDASHLLLGSSPSGLRVGHCGVAFLPNDELEERSFEDRPSIVDICDACHVASRRVPPASFRHAS